MEVRSKKFRVIAELWRYQGKAGWCFLTLGKSTSEAIRTFIRGDSSAWGSVKVSVSIGDYDWQTSIFPDAKSGSYLLPVKKKVRTALHLSEGTMVRATLSVTRDVDLPELALTKNTTIKSNRRRARLI